MRRLVFFEKLGVPRYDLRVGLDKPVDFQAFFDGLSGGLKSARADASDERRTAY